MEATTESNWTATNMPDQSGRTVIITGANSGLGLEATKAFARKGGHVVMACRSLDRANRARRKIESMVSDASLTVLELDLASQASIRQFGTEFESEFDRLDVLLNNAGIMMTPYSTTEDGFERQLGVNHLGHFALTGLLLDHLVETDGETRVVTQSSIAHKSGSGEIHFDDLNGKQSYSRFEAYAQSKLANLLFTYELDRRLRAVGADTIAVAAHPGSSATELASGDTEMDTSVIQQIVRKFVNTFMTQSAVAGALPALYAATAANVDGGHYIGPGGLLEMRGNPTHVVSNATSYDHATARRLWEVSEELTGVTFEFEEPQPA
ncbi:oxidoreductase [Haladaptatus sp. AB643]|uniref:oxidoreductase n=1 Tax=Haladaptatus sp. AB643 TaxID=2934174 RepID=UPI0021125D9F|nr:oxidoreductase [Haladaptatus sp. AB643]